MWVQVSGRERQSLLCTVRNPWAQCERTLTEREHVEFGVSHLGWINRHTILCEVLEHSVSSWDVPGLGQEGLSWARSVRYFLFIYRSSITMKCACFIQLLQCKCSTIYGCGSNSFPITGNIFEKREMLTSDLLIHVLSLKHNLPVTATAPPTGQQGDRCFQLCGKIVYSLLRTFKLNVKWDSVKSDTLTQDMSVMRGQPWLKTGNTVITRLISVCVCD